MGNFLPHTVIVPEIGLTNPAIVLSNVVLPIPETPVNTIISPGNTSNLSI
tara:strand:- start:782 stop:931 length:150 start_codon:yes stop_codon:yes gene_type:complete